MAKGKDKDSRARDKKDRGKTSGDKSSDRRDDTSASSKATAPQGFGASNIDFSNATPVSDFPDTSSAPGLSFGGTGGRDGDEREFDSLTAALEAAAVQNDIISEQLDKVTFDFVEQTRMNADLVGAIDVLSGLASAGGAPNPEMGGSPQRRSQLDLVESEEFGRFNREVADERTVMDRVVDFFSPVESVPTVDQETGMFGFTSEIRPEKFSNAANIASEIFDIDTSFGLGDFTSATDVMDARRREREGPTSGERSSERRDSDSSSSQQQTEDDKSSDKDTEDEEDNGEEEFESLIPPGFFDFTFGTPFNQLPMPQFVLIGNPNFTEQFKKSKDSNNG